MYIVYEHEKDTDKDLYFYDNQIFHVYTLTIQSIPI